MMQGGSGREWEGVGRQQQQKLLYRLVYDKFQYHSTNTLLLYISHCGIGLSETASCEMFDVICISHTERINIYYLCFQFALRLIAFRQIHKVLGMEPLPMSKFNKRFNPRKRRWTNSETTENDGMWDND